MAYGQRAGKHTSGSGMHVGRIGVLAAALGIGAAILGLPGVAYADAGADAPAHASAAPARGHVRIATVERLSGGATKTRSSEGRRRSSAEPSTQRRHVVTERRTQKRLLALHPLSHDTDVPNTPVESPLASSMLAYVRRQDDKPGPATTSGLTTGLVAEQADPISVAIDDLPAGPVALAGHAIAYQVTTRPGSPSGSTRVSVLDSDGRLLATSRAIAGVPDPDCQAIGRPDGTLVLVTLNDGETHSKISIINARGKVIRTRTVLGRAESVTASVSGAVFVDTSWTIPFFPTGYGDLATVYVSAHNTVRSFAPSHLTMGPDGTTYVVSSFNGAPTLMIRPHGWIVRLLAPLVRNAGSAPVFAADGTAYWAVGSRSLFGGEKTRLYTLDRTMKVSPAVIGLPGGVSVTNNGVILTTYTGYTQTAYDGTTHYTWINDNKLEASQALTGGSRSQVTPGGTVYTALLKPSQPSFDVVVMDSSGDVKTVTLPGTFGFFGPVDIDGSGPHIGEQGYVTYESGGSLYLAVLNPDASIARTVTLPEGASYTGPVFFGPDGAPYLFIGYENAQREVVSQQILALASDTYTPRVSAPTIYEDPRVQFSPDGTGYLMGDGGPAELLGILGFDASGDAVVAVTDPPVPAGRILTFGPDGTAYTLVNTNDAATVYALSSSGPTEILPLTYTPGLPVVVGPDGTLYLTTSDGFDHTIVTLIPPTTADEGP